MKEKINKIMEPARKAMNCIDYNEGIVIGSSFGQLISIIEEQQKKIEKLEQQKIYVMFHEGYGGKSNIAVTRDKEVARKSIQGFRDNGIIASYEELEMWDISKLQQQEK